MSSLEALLNAEASLMDPDAPFDFGDWDSCTCGHIYHGVTGEYDTKSRGMYVTLYKSFDPYRQVMKEVAGSLDLVGWNGENPDYPQLISDYTKQVSGVERTGEGFPYYKVTREDSLKVIREAIAKIREMDQVVVKSIDAHTYEVV